MKTPLHGGYGWLELEEVDSTQNVARQQLQTGGNAGIVVAHNQTAGVGRFGRHWVSTPDESLTISLIFRAYPNHPRPYLIGMAVALAVAGACRCQLQWPNDLVLQGRKVGGILSEVVTDDQGRRVAIVGLGINLNQTGFPAEIEDRAVSLHQAHGGRYDPLTIAKRVVERLEALPEPDEWSDLAPIWSMFDRTPGKHYVLPDGKEAVAVAIGSYGQLLCSVHGESQTVLAADAIFGVS